MSSLVQSMAVPVTEDTPPDLLAGSMDLTVLLPDGRAAKTSVQRATPMMDLLVQLCTAHRLSPGGHSLQPLGEKGALPYKPSTPIGLLDAWSVRLLPKGAGGGVHAEHPHQLPFQHTFRLQVHLPRNQLLVSRVTPQMGLAAVLKMACDEKNLDPKKYELRHPINLEERLRPELTLGDYGLTEVCVVARGDAGGADALALQREQERRRRRARQQHGHLAPAPPGPRQSGADVSASTGSVSSGSLGGRSSSPDSTPAVPPPRVPARKRRPAPPPPSANAVNKQDASLVISKATGKQVTSHHDGNTPVVTHSRTSSDSSGYHEASVLSDGPDTQTNSAEKRISQEMPPPTSNSTLPRRSKLPPATGTVQATVPKVAGPTVTSSVPLSRSMSNLATAAPSRAVHGEHSTSTSSLSSTGRGHRKKKAAPPPPPVAAALAGARAVSLDRVAATPASKESQVSGSGDVKSQTLPRATTVSKVPGASAAQRAASIEEEKEVPSPERRPSRDTTVKHHQQQQRSSSELTAEKADLYAKLQRRLPSRGDSVTSTSSSGSDDTPPVGGSSVGKTVPQPAAAVRPSRNKDKAAATTLDRAQAEGLPQPDLVSVPPPPGSVSSKHSSLGQDEDDLTVDEGIGNEDAAEEVARAFASAAAELEAAILAEDLAAAAAAAEAERRSSLGYDTFDPPCPKSRAANCPPAPVLPSPEPPVSFEASADSEDWHYEIPAPPSAFRDPSEPAPTTPWSYGDGEVHSKDNPLYTSGEFESSVTTSKEKAEDVVDSTHPLQSAPIPATVGMDSSHVDVAPPVDQSALSGQDRQVRNLMDAKARMLLPPPLTQEQTANIHAPAVPVQAKGTENEPAQDDLPELPDVQEDASTSQVNNSHSLLHHAGHLHLQHQHTISHHQHDLHHHHHHHHHHHEHDAADVEMPAYLTETIDTLEGFEDLIAVGAGSRPIETQEDEQTTETSSSQVVEAVEPEIRLADEQLAATPVTEKTADREVALVGSSGAVVTTQEQRKLSDASVSSHTDSKTSSGSSADVSVEVANNVPPLRQSEEENDTERVSEGEKVSKEPAVDEGATSNALEPQRQGNTLRRRTVEVGPLVNFTITTYQREIDADKIFAEGEATTAPAPRPSIVAAYEKRPSLVSRSNSMGGSGGGSSAPCSTASSRRGSRTEQQAVKVQGAAGAGVKRSASSVYAALQDIAAREEAHNKAQASHAADASGAEASSSAQLQSLQVLRSILPQLKYASEEMQSRRNNKSETGTDNSEPVQEKQHLNDTRKSEQKLPEVEVPPAEAKPQQVEPLPAEPVVRQPYRPPAVSFASWGERPRSQAVSLKVDSDYRVGGAYVKNSQEQKTVATTSESGIIEETELASQKIMTVKTEEAVAPPKVEPTVIRISSGPVGSTEPRIHSVQLKASPPPEQPDASRTLPQRSDPPVSRLDGTALTMRIISHTTAVPFVRHGSTTSITVNGTSVGNSETGEERVVPIVRAVELKKSILQQKQQQQQPEINGEDDSGKFLGVSSLAKRFSGLGDGSVVQRRNFGGGISKRRPVSELVTASDVANASSAPDGLVHRTGSFTSLITATRLNQPMAGRSDSSDEFRVGSTAGLSTHNGTSSLTTKQAPSTVSAAPKGFPVPVVKGFRVPGGNAPEPRKGITIITKPKTGAGSATPAPTANPHEQLMAAIRGFGGSGSLRNNTQSITECES